MAVNKEKVIAQAQKLVEKGQVDKAIKEFLKVVADDPKDVRVWLKLADLYSKIGKKSDAASTLQRVAEFYAEQGFYLKAVAVYKQILKVDPRQVEINQRLADLYKQLGLLPDARDQYEAMAAFFTAEGRTKDALAAMKQIVELDPENVDARRKLGEVYVKEQMQREAIDEFGRAAEQMRAQKNGEGYLQVAERLLTLTPDNRALAKDIARVHLGRSDPRRALPKLQLCFKADPHDAEVLGLLADAFAALEQPQKAVTVLKEQARVYQDSGDRRAADEVFRRVLVLSPQDADARAGLAGRASAPARPHSTPAQTEFERAPSTGVEDADEALQTPHTPAKPAMVMASQAPPLPQQRRTVSTPAPAPRRPEELIAGLLSETDVYVKYELYTKAIDHLQRVFALDSGHVEAREKLKALYLTVGRPNDAVRELKSLAHSADAPRARRYMHEILEIDPTDREALGVVGDARPVEDAGFSEDVAVELSTGQYEIVTAEREAEAAKEEDDLIPLVIERERAAESETRAVKSVESEPEDLTDDAAEVEIGPVDSMQSLGTLLGSDERDDDFIVRTDRVESSKSPRPTKTAPPVVMRGEPTSLPELGDLPLEEELDDADFFVRQQLFDEARTILERLQRRHPGNEPVAAKLRGLFGRASTDVKTDVSVPLREAETPLPINRATETANVRPPVKSLFPDGGEGRGEDDGDTHHDLGIAYREMGLYDDAVREFKMVMAQNQRVAQCHLMIGLCLAQKGDLPEAVSQLKKGLYADGITEAETLSLYFELGQVYERAGDAREAIYYFDKVLKRDAEFRGVAERIEGLRAQAAVEPDVEGEDDDELGDAKLRAPA